MSNQLATQLDAFHTRVAEALNSISGLTDPAEWLVDTLGGGTAKSGVRINLTTAVGLPSVFSAVQRIAAHVGLLPVEVKRKVGESARPIPNHPATRLLQLAPNMLQTPMVFRETLMLHALLSGNGRAWINRNGLGQPTELLLLMPWDTYTLMVGGEKWHATYIDREYLGDERGPQLSEQGTRQDARLYKIPDSEVFHIPGLASNGLWGFSLIHVAKEVLGIDAAGLQAAGASFGNNGRPGLVLEAPANLSLSNKEADEIVDNWNEAYEGIDNAGRTGLIRNGMKLHVLPISNSDAQFLESREFSRRDIALLFGTEAVMESSAVYKNLTERNSAYVLHCLNKWLEKWEQEIRRKLFSDRERNRTEVFAEFDASQLLRGDPNTLADYTGKLRAQGLISGDEGRAMHGLNPAGLTDDFGNPAISADGGNDDGEESDDDGEETENGPPDDAVAIAIERSFANLLKHEARRIVDMTRQRGNYLGSVERFYVKFEPKLAETCREWGIDPRLATDHCETSMREILDVAGTVTAEGLTDAMTEITYQWPDRASEFVSCLT